MSNAPERHESLPLESQRGKAILLSHFVSAASFFMAGNYVFTEPNSDE